MPVIAREIPLAQGPTEGYRLRCSACAATSESARPHRYSVWELGHSAAGCTVAEGARIPVLVAEIARIANLVHILVQIYALLDFH